MWLRHHFRGQKVKGQGHQAALLTAAYNASGSCSGQRGNVLGVGNYCYVAVCSAALGASAPTEWGEERGHIVAAARLQLVIIKSQVVVNEAYLTLKLTKTEQEWSPSKLGGVRRRCLTASWMSCLSGHKTIHRTTTNAKTQPHAIATIL